MEVFFPIVAFALVILLMEFMLWRMFRAKVSTVTFPHATDHSAFAFFSVGRLRFLAMVHAVVLIVCLAITYVLLW
jgi:hypothetical protein